MAEIMMKFRIKYTSLKMVDDISVQPRQETQNFFDKVILEFRKNDSSENSGKLLYFIVTMYYYLQIKEH
jgi:hypothetical protein